MKLRKLALGALVAWGLIPVLGAAAASYNVDPVHSTAIFRIKHMNTSFSYGRFNALSGQFTLDEKDPAQSRFDLQVKTDSIDTGNAGRDKHLKGPDFLNVAQYPTMTFKSKSVSRDGADAYQVSGDLTLHGVTRAVTVKVTRTGAGKDMRGRPLAGFETQFAIRRSDFKMENMVGPVGDDVTIIVSVEGSAAR